MALAARNWVQVDMPDASANPVPCIERVSRFRTVPNKARPREQIAPHLPSTIVTPAKRIAEVLGDGGVTQRHPKRISLWGRSNSRWNHWLRVCLLLFERMAEGRFGLVFV